MNVNMKLSKWQQEYIKRFDDELVIARTGISAGKSHILAIWLILQCIKKPGIRGIIIAQTYRALSKVLVREIQLVAAEMGVNVNLNKSSMELNFDNGSQLYGYSAENPDALLGLTEISILAIDEAAYCNEEIYNNARDRMRGSKYKSLVRLISSPQSMAASNYFTTLCKKYPKCVITATALDNPFTSDEFKNELKERYGEGSNLYRQQVLGELFDTDLATQIIFRNEFSIKKQSSEDICYFGYDASGLGADRDVFVVIDKYGLVDYRFLIEADTFEKVELINSFYSKYNIVNGCADGTGGYSAGVLDLLKTKKIAINSVNFSQKAYSELYPNARTEMYIETAKKIKEGFYVCEEAKEEFLAQQSFINNHGQLSLVPKADVKKIIGKSPDFSDAISLAVYAMVHNNSIEHVNKNASDIADKYLNYFMQSNY